MELAQLLGKLSARGSLRRLRVFPGDDNKDLERENDPVGEFLSRKRKGIASPEEENVLELEEYGEELRKTQDSVGEPESKGQPEMDQQGSLEADAEEPVILVAAFKNEAVEVAGVIQDDEIPAVDVPEAGNDFVKAEPAEEGDASVIEVAQSGETVGFESRNPAVNDDSPDTVEFNQPEQNEAVDVPVTQPPEEANMNVAEIEAKTAVKDQDNKDGIDDLLDIFKSEKETEDRLGALYEGLSELSAHSLLEESKKIAGRFRKSQ